jgi:hypothetical protein
LRALAIVALRGKIAIIPEENGVFGDFLGLPDKDEVRILVRALVIKPCVTKSYARLFYLAVG